MLSLTYAAALNHRYDSMLLVYDAMIAVSGWRALGLRGTG